MIFTNNLGYPRIGSNRELKFALESFWKNKSEINDLVRVAEQIQKDNWKLQQSLGIDLIPSNDFSFYDHVLDTAFMVGAIPPRFQDQDFRDQYRQYFAMARGFQRKDGENLPAMEMTKWFNTNYHYIVPEISRATSFSLNNQKPLDAFKLAQSIGIKTKPVLLGPVSFLLLSKSAEPDFEPLEKISELIPIYQEVLVLLKQSGADWVQIDEPFLSIELSELSKKAYIDFFKYFSSIIERSKVLLTSYFDNPKSNIKLLGKSPFEGLHLDLTNISSPESLLENLRPINSLSLGVIDGRNVWRQDLDYLLEIVKMVNKKYEPENLIISPSCSLMHVPQDIMSESTLCNEIKSWLSFAVQKLEEVTALKKAFSDQSKSTNLFSKNRKAIIARKALQEKSRLTNKSKTDFSGIRKSRISIFENRKIIQKNALSLPILPTTTIGSFPQTGEVRKARAQFSRGELGKNEYQSFLKEKIREAIHIQEEIGLDVLVHGEFERNDMVQYFGEKLEGFAFTENGWVQSFGSRYVRPPIIHGFVSRTIQMTVEWAKFAQSQTTSLVKGMLTGPVTILQWSYVRDDQPRAETCREIAYAIREEVNELESAGIKIIQIDEPALREGLPLHESEWKEYLNWAVECFKIASSGVRDETQIHTHMCYAEFNDIIESIAEMDADVISIEASRSRMELLEAFKIFNYPNDIGPGVYDIHSPNIPDTDEIVKLIESALKVIPAEQLWINPDCGLKTRAWNEVIPSLKAMVKATNTIRKKL